jgi:CheY-like chemotaxis protein
VTIGDKIKVIKKDARMLIVEGNHINQVVLKTMLQRLNIKNGTADHGRKALSILRQANANGEGSILYSWIVKYRLWMALKQPRAFATLESDACKRE